MANQKLLKWHVGDTNGRLEFFTISFFDGKRFLELKPQSLRERRIDLFETSINNPKVFCALFNLESPRKTYYGGDVVINSLFGDPVAMSAEQFYQHSSRNVSKTTADLELGLNDMFFKIDKIQYQKLKESIPGNNNEEFGSTIKKLFPDSTIVVHNFCEIDSIKFVISNRLKIVLIDLVQAPVETIKKLTNKKNLKTEFNYLASKSANKKPEPESAKFLFSDWREKKIMDNLKTKTRFIFGFRIMKPEFNIYDDQSETQILFASENESVCMISQDYLKYDIFQQDPKINIDVVFNQLELLTGFLKSSFTT